ncbi:hypothetical protein [Geodermatophilus sp. SYSU D01176]
MRGPVLLLLVACLAVVVGALVEGRFWLSVVALALSLVLGAVALSAAHWRA